MTQKRRVIYMTDPEWSVLQVFAQGVGSTASAIIREAVNAHLHPVRYTTEKAEAQAERDAILRRINK